MSEQEAFQKAWDEHHGTGTVSLPILITDGSRNVGCSVIYNDLLNIFITRSPEDQPQ